jgi:hypothetical protein
MYAYWTQHSIRKCAPDCHIFVKELSLALDTQRLLRKQIKIFKHRGHSGHGVRRVVCAAGLTPGSLQLSE